MRTVLFQVDGGEGGEREMTICCSEVRRERNGKRRRDKERGEEEDKKVMREMGTET